MNPNTVFMRLINLMYDTVTCLTTTPLRMLSLLGSIIAIGGFSIAVLLVILRLTFGPQWAAEGVFMLFAVLFTFIGAQFIGMGLLGEYIGRDLHRCPRPPPLFCSASYPSIQQGK